MPAARQQQSWQFVSIITRTKVHDVVPADGAVVDDDVCKRRAVHQQAAHDGALTLHIPQAQSATAFH